MSDDLKLFSSPEIKDTVQDMRDLLSQSRLAFLLGAEQEGTFVQNVLDKWYVFVY